MEQTKSKKTVSPEAESLDLKLKKLEALEKIENIKKLRSRVVKDEELDSIKIDTDRAKLIQERQNIKSAGIFDLVYIAQAHMFTDDKPWADISVKSIWTEDELQTIKDKILQKVKAI